jgi:hypothetical protein
MTANQMQPVPLFLIVLAAISIAIGSHFQWHDLVTFALSFGGAGVGILTGRFVHANGDTAP